MKNVEPVLAELFDLAPISGWQIFGNVSKELQEGLRTFGDSQNIEPQFSHYLSGFVRQRSEALVSEGVQ